MHWNIDTLQKLAESQEEWVTEREGSCISISNDEGVDAFVYAGDKQIVVETVLFPASAARDQAALNTLILQSHQLVPLTSVGLSNIGGDQYYVAFGALSVGSKEEVVIEEIETLLANVPEFLGLYSEYLVLGEVA